MNFAKFKRVITLMESLEYGENLSVSELRELHRTLQTLNYEAVDLLMEAIEKEK